MTPESLSKEGPKVEEILNNTGFYLCLDSRTDSSIIEALKTLKANVRVLLPSLLDSKTLDDIIDQNTDKFKVVIFFAVSPYSGQRFRSGSKYKDALFIGVTRQTTGLFPFFTIGGNGVSACDELLNPEDPDLDKEIAEILEDYY